MKRSIYTSITIGLLSISNVLAEAPSNLVSEKESSHYLRMPASDVAVKKSHVGIPVAVSHPGISSGQELDCILFKVVGANDLPEAYYMNVDSVFCREGDCAVVSVRLFWDPLGFYDRYELAPGIQLEKREGKPFLEEDYTKLDRILHNRDSPFKGVNLDNIIDNPDVDGVSGATVSLAEEDTVKGAAWTCYTLWHWANGKVFEIIRQETAESYRLEQLHECLKGDENHRIFALQEMINRRAYDNTSVELVITEDFPGSESLDKFTFQYMENAPESGYFYLLEHLFKTGNSKQRALYLNSLIDSSFETPAGFLDRFSRYIPELESYYEVHLILGLAESKELVSSVVIEQVMPLLDNPSFLVARKAYWFLDKHPLTNSQRQKLETFQIKFQDRL